ncbi:MAG: hypothetical protein GAK43_00993 [Stenotrophomonas maltophilia]|nr:MAG: hypothetical protein GAK43_00993 [Stenotrophomonas maltophilia]
MNAAQREALLAHLLGLLLSAGVILALAWLIARGLRALLD